MVALTQDEKAERAARRMERGQRVTQYDWASMQKRLPACDDGESEAVRRQAFATCDTNGNGYLSLEEWERGIREVLDYDISQQVFRAKPPIMKAFQAAQMLRPAEAGMDGDEYISWAHFRLLVSYLYQYFECFLMFQALTDLGVEGHGARIDDRLTFQQFKLCKPLLEVWCCTHGRPAVQIESMRAEFGAMDLKCTGKVTFGAFARYALHTRHLLLEDGPGPRIHSERPPLYDLSDDMPAPLPSRRGARESTQTYAHEGEASHLMRSHTRFNWVEFSTRLPTRRDAQSTAQRRKLFRVCDANANGFISLAEFDRGLKEIFGVSFASLISHAKPAIMRAYQAAKRKALDVEQLSNLLGPGLNPDDYVSWPEFRLLLAYLRQYLELWLMFETIDGGVMGDRRLTEWEFIAAMPMIERWATTNGRPPLQVDDPAAEFKRMDRDGSGAVRFDEFSLWAFERRLSFEDNDEASELDLPDERDGLADADMIGREAGLDLLQRSERIDRALRQMSRPLISDRIGTPAPPTLVRARMQTVKAATPNTPSRLPVFPSTQLRLNSPVKYAQQSAMARSYLTRYTSQYKMRMLDEMRTQLRTNTAGMSGGRALPLYESERLIRSLEVARGRASNGTPWQWPSRHHPPSRPDHGHYEVFARRSLEPLATYSTSRSSGTYRRLKESRSLPALQF